jgi:hypothetical protein
VATITTAMAAAAAVKPASSMWMIDTDASLVLEPYKNITADTVVMALTKK